jgi:hypothetical protein
MALKQLQSSTRETVVAASRFDPAPGTGLSVVCVNLIPAGEGVLAGADDSNPA